jgi:hypothetical protein
MTVIATPSAGPPIAEHPRRNEMTLCVAVLCCTDATVVARVMAEE